LPLLKFQPSYVTVHHDVTMFLIRQGANLNSDVQKGYLRSSSATTFGSSSLILGYRSDT